MWRRRRVSANRFPPKIDNFARFWQDNQILARRSFKAKVPFVSVRPLMAGSRDDHFAGVGRNDETGFLLSGLPLWSNKCDLHSRIRSQHHTERPNRVALGT